MQSQISVQYIKENPKDRYNQCDILRGVSIFSLADVDENDQASILETNLDFALIINQDCDLEQDFLNKNNVESKNQDKLLPNILILPGYIAQKFRLGSHRGESVKGAEWPSTNQWQYITSNQHSRFHYINSNEALQVPELVLDFKHTYTINRELAYKKMNDLYLISISELFREHISQRYANYLGRIGLPDKSTN